jgi:hypothetical protein
MHIFHFVTTSITIRCVHSRYFFGRTGRIRAVEVRPQKFRANFFRFGRISSIGQPKNLLKLNCADSPISGEKNNYCVLQYTSYQATVLHTSHIWACWKCSEMVSNTLHMFDPEKGLWPAPDSKESLIKSNFGHDGTLSIRNFVLMMIKNSFDLKCFCCSCGQWPRASKKWKFHILVFYRSEI